MTDVIWSGRLESFTAFTFVYHGDFFVFSDAIFIFFSAPPRHSPVLRHAWEPAP